MKSTLKTSFAGRSIATVLFVLAASALWTACTEDSGMLNPGDDAAAKGGTNTGSYNLGSVSSDGLTWTFTVGTPKGTKDASHFLLQFQDCDGTYVDGSYISSVSINGTPWQVLYSTGSGAGCSVGNGEPFIKLEGISGKNFTIEVILTKSTKTAGLIIKSGTSCAPITTFTSNYKCPVNLCEFETAWAAGTRYVDPGNWATYTTYVEGSVVAFAGQTNEAADVSFSPINNGIVTISIIMREGWALDPLKSDPVKIQGYTSTPPAKNPSPGTFTTYKGNLLTIEVPYSAFYGIHLDVAKECE